MFEASIRAGTLRDLIVSVIGITGEVYLRCEEKGVGIKAVDSAHVSLVDVYLDKEAFDYYGFKTGVVIGLDITKMKEVLSLASPEKMIKMKLGEKNTLNLSVDNVKRRMKVLDFGGKEPSVPPLELSTSFELPTERFNDALKGVETVSDHVIVEYKDDDITLSGVRNQDEIEARFTREDLLQLDGPEARSVYSLDYVLKMAKSITGQKVRFEFAKNFPLRISFTFADGMGRAMFLIAPRLEG
jgi:proliferating cell nuclear antigen